MYVRFALFGAIFISVTSGYCDDCTDIYKCKHLLNQSRFKSNEIAGKFERAVCAKNATGPQKVCCLDFVPSFKKRFGPLDEEIQSDDENSNEDEIVSHPNINLLPEACGLIHGNRIFGGTVASPFEFPWIVLIAYNNVPERKKYRFECGGSLISSRYVLSAAHCIKSLNIAFVRVGEYNIEKKFDCFGEEPQQCNDPVQDIKVARKVHHQKFVSGLFDVNDIGLLRLERTVDFSVNNARAICLPVYSKLREVDITGQKATVAGWGKTEVQSKSDILMKVEVPIYSTNTCTTYYGSHNVIKQNLEMKNMLCAGQLGRDSCKGDSGGPLMFEGEYNGTYRIIQYGVISFGPINCGISTPGIYTDVRNYLKWILDTLQP